MKVKFVVTLALCLGVMSSLAQNYSIQGISSDTSSKVNLAGSTIIVLNAKDSIMNRFTYSADNGSFKLNGLPAGSFILLAIYPDYADYIEPFSLNTEHPQHDFGHINMQLKTRLLQEVKIKGEVIPLRMRGDTTEYDAKAYVIQPNSKVEDLLKQLPGIQVSRNGKITAQGKTVTKVLVDGEEFFGDDPLLVTRNIRGDMVDKVLLYDKKSDQATFTGIDDGVRTKTIDIKLKEDRKNGVFGKVIGGIGTRDYKEGQAMYNRFRQKEKISVYVTSANDGKLGLGFTDNSKLGTSGNDVQINDSGGVSIDFQDDLESSLGRYNGYGVPVNTTAGLHYDNKSADDNQSVNTNYKIVSLGVTGTQHTEAQQTLPTGIINRNTNQNFDNNTFRQKFDLTYQDKLSATANLKVAVDGALKNIRSKVNTNSNSTDEDGNLLNQNTTNINSTEQQKAVNASAFYTKKFKKTGRTFSWLVNEAYLQSEQSGNQYSVTNVYLPSIQADTINQYKPIHIKSSVLTSNMTFSEQLVKNFSVIFNYALSLNNSMANRASYNQSASGRYDSLDYVYSNNYTFNQLANQVGVVFNYTKKKTILNFGTKAAGINFKQIDAYTGNVYKRSFINWTPQLKYQYQFTSSRTLSLYYNGDTRQPTIDQIQPIAVNTDPLNIYIGNPVLRPSFSNSFGAYYSSYNSSTTQRIYIDASYSFVTNVITNNVITNTQTGISTIQYVNLSGKSPYNYSLSLNPGRKIKAWNTSTSITLSTNGNVSYSYINNVLDRSVNNTYSASIYLSKNKANKYDIYVSGGPTYTISKMSLQPQINNNASGFTTSGEATIYLPRKFQLTSDLNYNYKAKTQSFETQNITLLKANVSKTFFKGNNLKLSVSGNDLLNQNLSILRSMYGNTTSQTSYTGIKRYFMLSVSWDFTRFKPLSSKN